MSYLGEKRAINVERDTSGLEYQITTTLKELAGEKKTVGVLSVGGGATLEEGMALSGRSGGVVAGYSRRFVRGRCRRVA